MIKVRILLFDEEKQVGINQIYQVEDEEEAMALKKIYEEGAERYGNKVFMWMTKEINK